MSSPTYLTVQTRTSAVGSMTSRRNARYTPPLLLSRSLEGLEKVIPPGCSSPSTPSWKFDKPLPDLPRPTSSTYSPDDEATGVIESRIPPCPRNTMITQPSLCLPSRTHSLGASDRYKSLLNSPSLTDVQKKSLSLQPSLCPSAPNISPATMHVALSVPTGPYDPDTGWMWLPQTRLSPEAKRATRGVSLLAHPGDTIDTIDSNLLLPALNYDASNSNSDPPEQDVSRESSAAMLDDSGSEACACELTHPLQQSTRRCSGEMLAKTTTTTTAIDQPRVMWLPSTGHLPMSKLAQEDPFHPDLHPASRPRPGIDTNCAGNRTELHSWSSSSCDETSTNNRHNNNMHITPTPLNSPLHPPTNPNFDRHLPRTRSKQLAIPISDYQRYGSKIWKSATSTSISTAAKRDRRPSAMFKKRMVKVRLKRAGTGATTASASTSRSPPRTPCLPQPRSPRKYSLQSSQHSPSSFSSPSSPLSALPRRMRSFLSRTFQSRNSMIPRPPSRPPRPPSPSPIKAFLPAGRERDWERERERDGGKRSPTLQMRGGLLRWSVALTKGRLGLGLGAGAGGGDGITTSGGNGGSGTGSRDGSGKVEAGVKKMTLKDRIVFVGPTDPAASEEERVNAWV
ncbi:hypothetical protein FQN52_006930 [Onygenales sp. PD_12]|nr:hypothetical protein FQN52_006930 [Onygenales sp. PD_12]KAK2791526.1 hypothetical protein FQN51_002197 [Onygenales sp. PD_10]